MAGSRAGRVCQVIARIFVRSLSQSVAKSVAEKREEFKSYWIGRTSRGRFGKHTEIRGIF